MAINNTLAFYNSYAKQFIEQTVNVDMQSLYLPFVEALPNLPPSEQHILDLGCGSGRDSFYFSKLDFNVTAIDGSQALISLADQYHAISNNIDWCCMKFSDLEYQDWRHEFTGIWACASLLHSPFKELPHLFKILISMLTAEGVIYASFKYGSREKFDNGRFFCDLDDERWAQVKSLIDVDLILDEVWITEDRRADKKTQWLNIIIKNAQ